jgi:hypothetical protein
MHCQSILKKYLLSGIFLTLWISLHSQPFTPELFREPTIGFWPRPLWFWNNTEVTSQGVTSLMEAMRDKCGYGGFGVVPFGKNFKPEYLSEDYLKVYGAMLAKAKELGMTISLYDEFGFPSGSVGAFTEGDNTPRFQNKYPDLTIQRLDKTEEMVKGPLAFSIKLPPGKFMGAVAISVQDKKRIDISGRSTGGQLNWNVPTGSWKIMMFNCVIDGVPIADYLNPDAIMKFTGMVHDVYYSRFKEYFGSVIYGTFYDEPSMFHSDFRMWTPEFNDKFIKKYGFSPVTLYPSLWYDIGKETGQARNLLFGFRAELYANGFNRVVNEWSLAHGITATGHTAPEEALVPANSAGDLMKSFKYLDIPGIDKIGGSRPAERFYKLVSSAAQNWDKRYVMSETYGAMPDYDKPGNLTWNQIDSIAIDQYTKGINMLIPHAVWYDNTRVTYKPELSHRNPLYADSLKYFTRFLSRLNVIMQAGGRHVADIAVLYPIDELLSEHWFYAENGPANIDGPVDPGNMFYKKAVKDIDYVNIGNWLISPAGKDFTYLHPEVLNERCVVSDGLLKLKNEFNSENFRIVIVPSCRLISAAALSKLGRFCQDGGTLIFTTRIPEQAAEPGMDKRIDSLMNKVLPQGFRDGGRIYTNNSGGKACFLPHPDGPGLRKLLLSISGDYDVSYPEFPGLQYIHKNLYGRNIYLFGNTRGINIDTKVNLKGKLELELWDPQTGDITPVKTETVINNSSGEIYTSVKLSLHPYRACFLIEKGKIDHCK